MSRHDATREQTHDRRDLDQTRLGRAIDELPDALRRITDAGVPVRCHPSDAEVKRKTAVASGLLEQFVSE
jgi:hypothetical protein